VLVVERGLLAVDDHVGDARAVVEDIAAQIEAGAASIIGVMVESHLVAGRQELVPGQPLGYGQSITDGCVGWDSSVQLLERLAQAVRARRLKTKGINDNANRGSSGSPICVAC
jgi:phospho-2-dehydro-3-deoxyheptonate aldolase